MNPEKTLARHSCEGRNPDKKIILRSRQSQGFVPLRGELFIHLDSGLRRNDAVFGKVRR
jgi:hypothetical protein